MLVLSTGAELDEVVAVAQMSTKKKIRKGEKKKSHVLTS